MAHPIDDSFTRLWDGTGRPLVAGDRPVSWLPLADLASGDVLPRVLGRLTEDYDVRDSRVMALTAMREIAWGTRHLVVTAVALRRLLLSPETSVAVDLVGDEGVWVRPGLFACMRNDPDAAHPDALPLAIEDDLWSRLHEDFTERFIAPVVHSLAASGRTSRRALWAMVTSSWASGVSEVVDKVAVRGSMLERARRMMSLHPATASATAVFYGPADAPLHWRAACCLWYRIPGEDYCEQMCPLLPEGTRALARIRDRRVRAR